MWSTIDRARRRLDRASSRSSAPAAIEEQAPEGETTAPPDAVEDVIIVFGSAEIDHLRVALGRALGDGVERADTPARIEHALSLLLGRLADPGRPHVLRRPAGVSTPESWEIHLDGVDHETALVVRDAGRTGRFNA